MGRDEGFTIPDIRRTKSPLDFFAEVHMRERKVCAIIDRIAASRHPESSDREQVISFLNTQLLQHIADEEVDLFPFMLDRCDPEDEIQNVIEKLRCDHRYAVVDTPNLLALLEDESAFRVGYSDEASVEMLGFAAHARRHLILENAILLPIARLRLTPSDLKKMKQHMLERRGLNPLEGEPNVE